MISKFMIAALVPASFVSMAVAGEFDRLEGEALARATRSKSAENKPRSISSPSIRCRRHWPIHERHFSW